MDTNVLARLRPRKAAAAAAAAAVAVGSASPAAACDAADAQIADASAGTLRHATVCLLNKRRASHGLSRLRRNAELGDAAQRYAEAMVAGDFFSHVSPGGSGLVDRLKSTGFITPDASWLVGENLAWGVGESGTPREIVRSWMRSAGHRSNILNPRFRHIGVGVAAGAPQPVDGAAATYASEFGD